jgi:hypothetical protein
MGMKSPSIQSGMSGHRHSPTASSNSLCASLTLNDLAFGLGKGSQHSPKKQTEMLAHWTTYAAGGVKNDDSQREKILAAEAKLATQQQLEEVSLIDFEDPIDCTGRENQNPVNVETMVEMKNGRKKWTREFQPANNAKHGFGYDTTPSMDSSTSGRSSGQQSLEDLMD